MRTNDDIAREPTLGDLRKLLALKRYEMPAPGYFNTFASKIIARIEADEPVEALSWWSRLLLAVTARPSLASGLALIVGLSALGATGLAPAVRSGNLEGDLMLGSAPVAVHAAMADWSVDDASAASAHPYLGASSVAPVLGPGGGPLAGFAMRPASYSLAD